MATRLLVSAALLLAFPLAVPAGPARSLNTGRQAQVVADGFRVPTSFAFLPGGRILVAEQRGLVRLVRSSRVSPRPFLDLRGRVNTFNERGLMAIAVRGSFLYAYYALETNPRALKAPTGMRLGRFRIRGDVAVRSSEVVVLGRRSRDGCPGDLASADCIPANCGCHVGGDIAFGRDGTIFLSVGDSANAGFTNESALRAQQLDSLAGKLLRVDARGRGLRSNPFWSGSAADNRSKVWALGLRNPFRFTLDRRGVPVVGDVGWLDSEELDLAVRGSNLGWPCYEGNSQQERYARWSLCQALYRRTPRRLRGPAYAYPRGRGAGIIGGAFVGRAYYFADVVRGWIQVLPNGPGSGRPRPFASDAAGPVAIETGPDGMLYYLSSATGQLRRVPPRE